MKKRFRAISFIASAVMVVAGLVAVPAATNAATVLTISTDLPLQGSSFDSNDSTNKAIAL